MSPFNKHAFTLQKSVTFLYFNSIVIDKSIGENLYWTGINVRENCVIFQREMIVSLVKQIHIERHKFLEFLISGTEIKTLRINCKFLNAKV